MIGNFITLAIRNFKNQFFYSLVNVIGLAVGIACSLVILVYVLREKGYEKHFSGHERIYRIATMFMSMGEFANGPQVLLEILPQEHPWVEIATGVKVIDTEINFNGNKLKESGLWVERDFFDVFPYDFLTGEGELKPNEIVLSRQLATTIFGDANPLGQSLELMVNEKVELFSVKGVIDTDRVSSHLNAPFWAVESGNKAIDPNWFSVSTYNYIKVREGISQAEIQQAMDKVIEKKVYPQLGSTLSFADWFARDDAFKLIVQPLDDIYLKGTLSFDLTGGGNENLVKVLLIVALLILLIASVNFVNLSTARAVKRAKEVGIKKVVGSTRQQLIFQFLSESILVSLLALVVALGMAEIILIVVEQLTGIDVLLSVFAYSRYLFLAIGVAVFLGFVSGIYPSLVLSAFRPTQVLKSGHSLSSQSSFRNVLVVFQFVLSTALIISTYIIFSQLNFLSNKDLGFPKENLLVIDNIDQLGESQSGLKEKLRNLSGVSSVSTVNRLPGSTSSFSIQNLKSDFIDEPVRVNRFMGDFDYPQTLGFQLINGRFFDRKMMSDSNAVILNETAVRELALENPIGEVLNDKYTVIGVVRDFNFENFKKRIQPSIIMVSNSGYQLSVRFHVANPQPIISEVEQYWSAHVVGDPLRYHFLDENFNKLMKNEATLGKVLSLFSGLAIAIACLGLFGLSAYLATQRRKEIGIRKVMGASVPNVLGLFGKEYSRLIILSFLVAIPLAIYAGNQWLSSFVYRVEISWWVVTAVCLMVLLVAWLTVGYHSIKASMVNPAKALREE